MSAVQDNWDALTGFTYEAKAFAMRDEALRLEGDLNAAIENEENLARCLIELRQAHGAAIIAQSEAVERMEVADQELGALRIMLLELCEKMEAGISGPEETKRARRILEEIKANQHD